MVVRGRVSLGGGIYNFKIFDAVREILQKLDRIFDNLRPKVNRFFKDYIGSISDVEKYVKFWYFYNIFLKIIIFTTAEREY